MAWESRIASSRLRRLVIGAVMLGLLAASTAVAMWMSEARRVRFDPAQPTHTLQHFNFSVPSNFEPYPVADHPEVGPMLRFKVEGPELRLLSIAVLPRSWPSTPLQALREAQRRLCPVAGWGDIDAGEFHGVSVLRAVGDSLARTTDRRMIQQMHVLAMVSQDGGDYLAVYLTGNGRINAEDVKIAEQIALSVRDTRFASIDNPDIQIGSAAFRVPKGLSAFTEDQAADGAVYLSPESGTGFGRLRVREAVVPAESEAESADQRLTHALAAAFAKFHGQPPPPDAMARTKIGDHDVYMLLLLAGVQHQVHHEVWAIMLDDERALLIDVIADPPSLAPARAAAGAVVQSLTINPENKPDSEHVEP